HRGGAAAHLRARAALARSGPAGGLAAHVDVREWTTRPHGLIHAETPDQLRVQALDALHGAFHHPHVAEIAAAIPVEVVHPAVAVGVYDDVGGVAVLVAALPRAPARIAEREIPGGRSEAGEHD